MAQEARGRPPPTARDLLPAGSAVGEARPACRARVAGVNFTAVVTRDKCEDLYVAHCVEGDVASQGESIGEALANLREAIELYFRDEDDASTIVALAEVHSIEVTIPV